MLQAHKIHLFITKSHYLKVILTFHSHILVRSLRKLSINTLCNALFIIIYHVLKNIQKSNSVLNNYDRTVEYNTAIMDRGPSARRGGRREPPWPRPPPPP